MQRKTNTWFLTSEMSYVCPFQSIPSQAERLLFLNEKIIAVLSDLASSKMGGWKSLARDENKLQGEEAT